MDDPKVAARVILVGEEMVGMVSRFPRDGADHVGYWLDRSWWGRGGRQPGVAVAPGGGARTPVVATAATSNATSLRVLQKCGFEVERVWLAPADDRHPACEEAVLVLRETAPATTAAS